MEAAPQPPQDGAASGHVAMANIITLTRLLLIFPLVALIYWVSPGWLWLAPPLLLLIIALDGLDGYVARKRLETSVFGSIFDIAADRVIEYVLWTVLGHVGLVPMWVALVFIIRGTLVDSIRYAAIADGQTAFEMMRSRLGRFLVAGRFMRGLYGGLKAVTFAWILSQAPLAYFEPGLWSARAEAITLVTGILVYSTVVLCLLRGVPVLVEFALRHRVFQTGETAQS
jgi:CDP-diacylglycerol--glycerol-3-phosphate 3-phosphatidyltransferase